ncbi:type II toxin-antitoxin system MqsA family antitoxin [Arhodomonas aquaeolei]|uniref:type II toxin-antitoxin system MqsA family antitoxin n=1 Tax=Arhodomonas aquaeolei TaxID=2369 RepID=UPI0021689F81|nr:type II toxin-antitoxin system MqsA family antitoxin [Arhodomonas aquaeolei]MCS4502490.1 type II toxin-antitoxin system MqsA family antitoxin [Arhodomonas aquaeolei]
MNREYDKELCPVCGEGHLAEHQDECEVEYRGRSERLPSVYSRCDVCGVEQTTAAQARRNKRETLAFRKHVDGLLTGQELRDLRERLAINQKQAAALFGGGPVAFSKYENDEVAQSEAMDRLLRLADAMPEVVLTWLRDYAGLPDEAGVHVSRTYTVEFPQSTVTGGADVWCDFLAEESAVEGVMLRSGNAANEDGSDGPVSVIG